MPCSPARLAANRENCRRSTGPRTAAGKERSRRNGLKHGLTGAGIVVPDEDVAAIQGRFDALEAELIAGSELGRILVHRVALLSVRLERSARHEAAAIGERMRSAEADFDEGRSAEVDRLMSRIASEPASVARRLIRTPEGIDRMVASYGDLKHDLIRDNGFYWSDAHQERAENLMGRYVYDYRISRVRALSEAIAGRFGFLGERDGAGLDDVPRQGWARAEMVRLIDAEVDRLRGLRDSFDRETIELDRAGSAARALFDASPEAILARKYEAASERGLFRSLREFRALDDETIGLDHAPLFDGPDAIEVPAGAEDPGPSRESTPESARGSLASSFRGRIGEATRPESEGPGGLEVEIGTFPVVPGSVERVENASPPGRPVGSEIRA